MTTYCYTDKEGFTVEVFRPMGTAPATIRRKGRVYRRDIAAEQTGKRNGNVWRNGVTSRAMAVLPKQIPELRSYLQSKGIKNPKINARGQPEFDSRTERREHARARGFVDYDGGYSDP